MSGPGPIAGRLAPVLSVWDRVTPRRTTQRFCHRIGYAGSDESPEAGFTLIEVIVSFVLFAIVIGGAVTGIVNSQRAAHSSQQRVEAANVAQSYLADLRSNPGSVRAAPAAFTANVKNEQFTVTPTIAFADGGSQCSTGGSVTVHVLVSAKSTGAFLARNDTVIACP